jgi:hypothetical protein
MKTTAGKGYGGKLNIAEQGIRLILCSGSLKAIQKQLS